MLRCDELRNRICCNRHLTTCAIGLILLSLIPQISVLSMVCGAWEVESSAQTIPPGEKQFVRIGVLSLFRPTELRLRSAEGSEIVVDLDGRVRSLRGEEQAVIRASGDRVQLTIGTVRMRGTSLRAYAPFGPRAADSTYFWLGVPGKLRRRYTGTLEIRLRGQTLEAIVTMPLETAVASIVQAESAPGAGMEALKAQAVAARSFLVARQTPHTDFDFCDTTHCQFLRSPPVSGSPADEATEATRSLILIWHDDAAAQDRTLAAMYSRSCGGQTRALREIGVSSSGYPYYAVRCAYCTRHPEIWQREAKSAVRTEQDRLAFNRIHGWGAIPSLAANTASNHFASDTQISGRGIGHGLGLCQLGAADMARHGSDFATILMHYYPNTRITTILAR